MDLDKITELSLEKSTSMNLKGTLKFMAPEVVELIQMNATDIRMSVKNIYEFGRKADVYSLALVIFDSYLISVFGLEDGQITRQPEFINQMLEKISTRN